MSRSVSLTRQASPRLRGTARHLVSFREDVVVDRENGDLLISHRWGNHVVAAVSDGVAAAVDRLTFGPVLAGNVMDLVITAAADSIGEIAKMHALVDALQFLLVHSVELDAVTVAEVVPISSNARFEGFTGPLRVTDGDRLGVSRFAYLHQIDGVLTLENPLSLYKARLHDPLLAALIAGAARPRPVAELVRIVPALGQSATKAVLDLLVAAKLLDHADEPAPEDEQARLRQWGFHDLLFHARSKSGRHDEEFGATFRFTGEIEHEAPIRELPKGPVIVLPRPALDDVLAGDATLTEVLETRQSVRTPGQEPLTVFQLSELLYRVARVRAVYGPAPEREMPYQGVDKPYPADGGAGELDLWLTVRRCEGLKPCMYYYDPAGHRLVLVNHHGPDADAMLAAASASAGNAEPPDVLLTITSRFQRLGWKYSGIPYATTLKHVGVLYQTLYLVGTAMGLAPCGLSVGVGNGDLSARCFGFDWDRESSVGHFMISSAPAEFDRRHHFTEAVPGWTSYNSQDWRTRSITDRDRSGNSSPKS